LSHRLRPLGQSVVNTCGTLLDPMNYLCIHLRILAYERTTPARFEPTLGDPIRLADRRLDHSDKMSCNEVLQFASLLVARGKF
jgi:hypothetical protein